ncbi:relaxase domain-containing protein [Methylobacterium sp. J-030]|uniref:MobF family relaxase n=1 Tax=Methylobacterium sp. J-030 TaxID=2836627 RepID=UPI001FBBE44C|nr:MobF family relaxase [Methylobacterium sp. J-030]MCJ2067375.1 relaxase domain-containing protein [Methylobacterium sp. J-030]
MMTCTRITSVEYYESMARQIKRESGLVSDGATVDDTAAAYARKEATKAHREGSEAYEAAYAVAFDKALCTLKNGHAEGRDQVAYYTDNGAGEANGVWWTRQGRAGSEPLSLPTPSPFRRSADGTEVDGRVLRDLAEGRDPESLDPLVKVSANGKRSVGYDMQFAAPKSVSVLAAFAEPEVRDKILAAHDRAVRRALDFAFDEGLIVTRTGAQGKERTPVEEVSAAVYRHFTSRAQDPQLHSHAVLLNLAVRADGKTGSIDNKDILRNAGGIAALYRSELASELRRELGVEAHREGRNFEVTGIPERVLEQFSKRRAEIDKAAKEGGFNTAANREAAQIAAFDTRAAKDKDVPLTTLEERWLRELTNAGWSPRSLFEIARVEGERARTEREGDGSREERLGRLALAGIESVTQTEAVIEHRHLLRHVAESLQCEANADEVLAAVKGLTERGQVIRLGETKAKESVYSTVELVEAERAMLRDAFTRQGEREFVSAAALDRVLANRPTMREEQKAAVRHALNRDGVAVVEGSAGSGKSFAMASVAEAARDAGAEVWTIAPSWKAVDVIRTDTETAEEMARAVAGFLHRVKKGDIELDRNTVIVTDEAGMIGTHDMAALVQAASSAGAKLVLTGDTRQLAPVVAGAPMRALVKGLGTSRMEEIQRQKGRTQEEGAWMRAASMDFAKGETKPALEAYDRAGAITWGDDRDAAIDALVRDYAADRQQAPDKTRAVLTGWNVDVQEINRRVRESLIAQGMLPQGRDTEVNAIPRGGSKPAALALAAGDDVIFGETVEVQGQTIRNADLARIERVDVSKTGEAVLTFRMAKNGATVTARESELVGFREEGAAKAPKLQHAYAMTTHAAQGVTVDQCYVANVRGMQSESTYVAMTRHRESVRLYADTSRVRDQLEARQPGVAPEERGLSGEVAKAPEISLADVRAALIEESAISGSKANASDFLPEGTNLRVWAGAEAPAQAAPPPPVEEPAREPFTPPAGLPRLPIRPGSPAWKAPGQAKAPAEAQAPSSPTTSQRAASVLRERMAARTNASVAYPVPSQRVAPEERDQMVRSNLMQFAQDHLGMKMVETWSGGSAGKFKTSDGNESVSISRKGDMWIWVSTAGREGGSGVIWNLVEKAKGVSYGQALHFIRDRLRTWNPSALVVSKVNGSGPEKAPPTLADVRRKWHKMFGTGSRYLTTERQIAPEIASRFRADIRAESEHERATNRGGVAFAHRNVEGDIVGYARRGFGKTGAGFKGFAAGGTPCLWQAGETRAPERIYITESAIDTLSIYQHDGGPGRALLTSTDGTPSDAAIDTVKALARRHPEAAWHVAMDNGPDGERFAAKVREAIREVEPDAKIEDRNPGEAFKDWNDRIRDVTAEQAAARKAEAKRETQMQVQAEQERLTAEAARQAVEEHRSVARPR